MGKPLQPKEIWLAQQHAKTRNAKVMRRMVFRSAYLGEEPGDTSSLVNPEAVSENQKGELTQHFYCTYNLMAESI